MARYIDLDKLIETIERDNEPYKSWDCTPFEIAMENIQNAPIADVVEVVRCADCKHYEIGKSYTPYCNNVMNLFEEMKLDDFCSYGERKTVTDTNVGAKRR